MIQESEDNECGYWDYDLHDKSGGWATNGCHLNRTEYGRHVCVCDHLTNFAVLVVRCCLFKYLKKNISKGRGVTHTI